MPVHKQIEAAKQIKVILRIPTEFPLESKVIKRSSLKEILTYLETTFKQRQFYWLYFTVQKHIGCNIQYVTVIKLHLCLYNLDTRFTSLAFPIRLDGFITRIV